MSAKEAQAHEIVDFIAVKKKKKKIARISRKYTILNFIFLY
jgi:hypothetical protein